MKNYIKGVIIGIIIGAAVCSYPCLQTRLTRCLTVSKYNGTARFDYDEGVFIVEIEIPNGN